MPESNNPTLELCYLYPRLLNIYGDRGNVLTLLYRCKQRNIDLKITSIGIGENIDPINYDIFFMGGGQDKQQFLVSEDLQLKKNIIM